MLTTSCQRILTKFHQGLFKSWGLLASILFIRREALASFNWVEKKMHVNKIIYFLPKSVFLCKKNINWLNNSDTFLQTNLIKSQSLNTFCFDFHAKAEGFRYILKLPNSAFYNTYNTLFKSWELSLINCSVLLTAFYHFIIYMHIKKAYND